MAAAGSFDDWAMHIAIVLEPQHRIPARRPSQQAIDATQRMFDVLVEDGFVIDNINVGPWGELVIEFNKRYELMQKGDGDSSTGFVARSWSFYGTRGRLHIDAAPARIREYLGKRIKQV